MAKAKSRKGGKRTPLRLAFKRCGQCRSLLTVRFRGQRLLSFEGTCIHFQFDDALEATA